METCIFSIEASILTVHKVFDLLLTCHFLYEGLNLQPQTEQIAFMEYSKLISVTGLSGLFELVSSKNDGAIVKSLETGSTQFVSSRKHQFSHLESIEIYTVQDNVNLLDLFKAMKAAGKTLPDHKDAGAVKAYFVEVYPNMDFERVYSSDMRKMVKWFIQIDSAGIEFKSRETAEEEVSEIEGGQ